MLHLGGDLLFQVGGGHAGRGRQRLVAIGGGIFARLFVRGLCHRAGHGIGSRLYLGLGRRFAPFTFVAGAGRKSSAAGMDSATSTLATANTTG